MLSHSGDSPPGRSTPRFFFLWPRSPTFVSLLFGAMALAEACFPAVRECLLPEAAWMRLTLAITNSFNQEEILR